MPADTCTRSAPLRGPLVTLAVAVAVRLLLETPLYNENLYGVLVAIPLLLAVIYAGLSGGSRAGLASAAIAALLNGLFFSQPETFLQYSDRDFWRVVTLAISLPIIGGAVGWRSDRFWTALAAEHELRDEASVARRLAAAVQEAYFGELFEGSPVAIVLLDEHDQCLQLNAEFSRMFGYSAADALGRAVNQLIVPEDLHEEGAELTRRVARGERVEFEAVRRRKDGTLLDVSVRAAPFRIGQGQFQVCATYQDISVRKRAEVEREHHLALFRSLVENMHAGVLVETAERKIFAVNTMFCELFGLQDAPTKLLGSDCARAAEWVKGLLAEPDVFPRRIEEVIRGHVPVLGEELHFADGRIIERDYVPIRAAAEFVGHLWLYHDRTERVRLEEQLRQSQKMEAVGRLAGGIAHDFNNLLTALTGYAELLLEELPAGDPRRPEAEEINRAAERAASLTRQLLAFSRQQVLQPRVLDLNQVVRGVEGMLRRLIGEDIEFRTRLEPALAPIKADAGQLEQVLVNLAVNARDAMPEGGRITVETANAELDEHAACRFDYPIEPGRYVVLTVSDTGVGMDAETRSHVFEPFFTTKEPGKGTGLGLSTVYGIVKQSDGCIRVESEPGRGACFWIYLPRAQDGGDPTTRATAAPRLAEVPDGGAATVLVVEDEQAVRSLVRRVLEKAGYEVLTCADGSEALRLASQQDTPIDLLVTDVVMPGINGRELGERLAALRPGLRTLYMSGHAAEAIVRHGVLDPGVDFLAKPFLPTVLVARVRQLLAAPERRVISARAREGWPRSRSATTRRAREGPAHGNPPGRAQPWSAIRPLGSAGKRATPPPPRPARPTWRAARPRPAPCRGPGRRRRRALRGRPPGSVTPRRPCRESVPYRRVSSARAAGPPRPRAR